MTERSSLITFSDTLESKLLQLETAWNQCDEPDLHAFVPEVAPYEYVLELVRIDVTRRAARGLELDVTRYLPLFASEHQSPILQEQIEQFYRSSRQGVTELQQVQFHTQCESLSFHAKGGLGEVLLAQDDQLHRRVAVKLLHQRWSDSTRARKDFLQEAKLTSQLEHPGIVPVHNLGISSDGRPCYSMRFIEGQTFRQAIAAYHVMDPLQQTSRRLAFRNLLTRFISVCQTVAYAHSKGILHLDLKPDNIMLGQFGETIVLDWGLARVSSAEKHDTLTAADDTLQDQHSTYSGGIQGTLCYLSPEQADTGNRKISPATDIFGLGATLYTILCNRPPYLEKTKASTFNKALLSAFPLPSQVISNVSRKLEAVCLKAMAIEPHQRYANALDLAGELEHYLADEPIQAYPEPWYLKAKRSIRKRKSTFAVLFSLGLVIPLALMVGSWFLAKEQAKSHYSEEQARHKERTTQQITDYLTRLFITADPLALESTGFLESEDQPNRQTSLVFLERGSALVREHLHDQPLVRARLLEAMGNTYRSLGSYDQAKELVKEALNLRQTQLASNHPDLVSNMQSLGLAEQYLGNYTTAERLFRQVLASREKDLGIDHPDVATSLYHLGTLTFYRPLSTEGPQFNQTLSQEAERLLMESLRIRRKFLRKDHPDIGFTLAAIASLKLSQPKQALKALEFANEAMEVFEKNNSSLPFGGILVMSIRAERQRGDNKFIEAERSYLEIIALMKKHLGPKHPLTILQTANLVGLLNKAGEIDRALKLAGELLEMIRPLAYFRSQPLFVEGMIHFTDILKKRGQTREARERYQEALQFALERPEENAKYIVVLRNRLK